MRGYVKTFLLLLVAAQIVSACDNLRGDRKGPHIRDISTSDKVVVISDCPSTSVRIHAKVTDGSTIRSVLLWYRVGADQSFAFTKMDGENDIYSATVEGADLQGHGYGPMEFYITAEDGEGNSSKSQMDDSIQFLPCVNS